jgi:hypothetical protein
MHPRQAVAAAVRIIFRPLTIWPGGDHTRYRKASQFSSTYPATLELLQRELGMLGVTEAVLQLAIGEADIRTDGMPRASARPAHPGVVLTFESRHGHLQYATDVFDTWHDNLRAIALSLEALRLVDRYGISKRGEQYTGWKALPAGGNGRGHRETAARFVLRCAGLADDDVNVSGVLDGSSLHSVYRLAARRAHPDTGGSDAVFAQLEQARRTIEATPWA